MAIIETQRGIMYTNYKKLNGINRLLNMNIPVLYEHGEKGLSKKKKNRKT